jgi:hypothetical protein
LSTTTVSPFFPGFPGTLTGEISSPNRPASIAARAFAWLASANSSCCWREIDRSFASFSAVSPINMSASGQANPSLYIASTTGA